jgi:hypothetical protein
MIGKIALGMTIYCSQSEIWLSLPHEQSPESKRHENLF